MSDFDTRRIGEIMALEEKILSLQNQLKEYKSDAEKWTPRVSTEASSETCRVTLAFGGKTFAATMPNDYLMRGDATTLTSMVIDTLYTALIADCFKPVIRPAVEKLQQSAASVSRAGKW